VYDIGTRVSVCSSYTLYITLHDIIIIRHTAVVVYYIYYIGTRITIRPKHKTTTCRFSRTRVTSTAQSHDASSVFGEARVLSDITNKQPAKGAHDFAARGTQSEREIDG